MTDASNERAEAALGDEGAAQPYLIFRLAGEEYAVEISRVREIIEYNVPTKVPMMPAAVCGVINLRGAVVPVIDLAIRFGQPATSVGPRTSIVIIDVTHQGGPHAMGLLVDRVQAVKEIAPDSIEPTPGFGTPIEPRFIEGLTRGNGNFIILLDVNHTLSIAEMAVVSALAADGTC